MPRSLQQRWRRTAGEAPVLPGDCAAMLSTRAEAQVAADWMAVPTARNLHWRYAVLHSAFMTCKQKVAPGESLSHNLECLVAATKIWHRIACNQVLVNGHKRNINGNIGLIFSCDDVAVEETNCPSYLSEHDRKYCRMPSHSA